MGERKVLNKYYAPDFDPSKLPRVRRLKNQQMKIRMMLPMSIRCNTCGNYIYKGTKFNSRKENVVDDNYLGIQIFRFYFKCTRCSAGLVMKTDPQNSDYVVESGATRNFEPWREEDEASEMEKRKRNAEELGDTMKSLENRTLDSKREIVILAALDEMKSMKSRYANVSIDLMLVALQKTAAEKEKKIEEEDEALIKSIVFNNSNNCVTRISQVEFDEHSTNRAKKQKVSEQSPHGPTSTKAVIGPSSDARFVSKPLPVKVSIIKKTDFTLHVEKNQRLEVQIHDANAGLESLCQYDSDEDSYIDSVFIK